jgi:hypothetical protein
MHRHKVAIIITWQIEAAISILGVVESFRKISFGADATNQMIFGTIIKRNKRTPYLSNPNLNFVNIHFYPHSFALSLQLLNKPLLFPAPYAIYWFIDSALLNIPELL